MINISRHNQHKSGVDVESIFTSRYVVSTKFRGYALNPLFFKYTIRDAIIVYPQPKSALVGGDFSRLQSTSIRSSLFVATSGMSLSKLGLSYFFQLSFGRLSGFLFQFSSPSSSQVLSVSFFSAFLIFSLFLSATPCLLFFCFSFASNVDVCSLCVCEHTWSI